VELFLLRALLHALAQETSEEHVEEVLPERLVLGVGHGACGWRGGAPAGRRARAKRAVR